MPVTPLGNAIYINQNMNVVANKQADMQNRFDLQSLAAMTLKDDQDKEVVEVRPTEETYKIDPEHQHEKSQSDQRESVFEDNDEQNLDSVNADKDERNSENLDPTDTKRILDIKI